MRVVRVRAMKLASTPGTLTHTCPVAGAQMLVKHPRETLHSARQTWTSSYSLPLQLHFTC